MATFREERLDTLGPRAKIVYRHAIVFCKSRPMISKTGLHAVRGMLALSRLPEGAYAGAASVAREIGAPQNYLGKLLQNLARYGLVESQKGIGGGFRLAKNAKHVTLFDIVDP